MKIIIYGRKGHAHTVAFKNYLRMADIPFEYKDVATDEKAKEHTKELYDGVLKYPTLFINDEVYLTPTSDEFNKILQEASLKG
ncbi:glutaredoxin family protein [Tenacibaculum retecalamus]|uniref:glutaredoxin family protein n=1 Tax=Tenacibaculum retecalamus TaxID=3018315 RepID=UPI0023D91B35|nr:glutaredoxin domain-containing protein [Tenacibaculum retecalamus]WBX70473.1 glutaredoxin domain-containing protein [Tenacibaculum retecalamus]